MASFVNLAKYIQLLAILIGSVKILTSRILSQTFHSVLAALSSPEQLRAAPPMYLSAQLMTHTVRIAGISATASLQQKRKESVV